jgi:hypothetical protein
MLKIWSTSKYHPVQCRLEDINQTITAIGEYTIGSTTRFASNAKNLAGILTIFVAILMLGEYTGGLDMSIALREEVTYSVLLSLVFSLRYIVWGCCNTDKLIIHLLLDY